ncbi:MAG TPA: hydrolase 1, exosortase A system-associated [Burkholderiaceae bacterium]
MAYVEQAVVFDCHGDKLIGVVAQPMRGATRGIVIAVGGAQYRAGSHRQFALMARHFAENGIAVLRFDYRGMGDSGGAPRPFDDVGDDLRSAVDCLCATAPGVIDIVVMGLCDGASAASLYAHLDPRVRGLILFNPWVRSEAGTPATSAVQQYYGNRLRDPQAWRALLSGKADLGGALRSVGRLVAQKVRPSAADKAAAHDDGIAGRMLAALQRFNGRVLVVLSSNDMTAQEFRGLAQGSPPWRALVRGTRFAMRKLDGADHTFSRRAWRDEACAIVCQWSGQW